MTFGEYIEAAAKDGAEVIIDSLSHAWSGSGGVLDMHDATAKAQRTANSFAAWWEVTPEHNTLVDAILQDPFVRARAAIGLRNLAYNLS